MGARGLTLPVFVGTDLATSTYIPDTDLRLDLMAGWDADLRWVLTRVWSPAIVAAVVPVRVAFDLGGRAGPAMALLPATLGPIEVWQPAPLDWDGKLVMRTTGKGPEVSIQGLQAPALADTVPLAWASVQAVWLQLQFMGFERPGRPVECA